MEKLYKYIAKLGIKESTRHAHYSEEGPAVFYREKYGDNNYFVNAPNFTYNAAVICLDFQVIAPTDYFMKQAQIEKMLQRYCRRYNYEIFNRSACFGLVSFVIATRADREKAENYYFFRDRCRNEADMAAHELYEAGQPGKVPEVIRKIVIEHGNYYNQFLQEQETRTA
jgi:hypothetical protein